MRRLRRDKWEALLPEVDGFGCLPSLAMRGEFPCGKFLNWYDPARSIVKSLRRAGLLALRKRIVDKAWVKRVKEKKIEFGG